ncbi:MAG: helix-turn-helix domain-containing protein [Kiritimatiellae bacterium]|nr:helix-turn-helix domain-containing protein [Kiritimatiellia bacterium]
MNPKPDTRNPQTSREAPNLAAKRPNLAPAGAQPRPAAGLPARNPTAEAIVSRLPDKPVVNAREIADALDMTGISAVTGAVDEGKLHAVKIGGQYRVARAEAARWIRSLGA